MEAASRASVNFLEQLHAFHSTRGSSHASIPIIEGKPVNLFALRREVDRLGGFEAVSTARKWTTVTRTLGYSSRSGPGVSTQVKSAYVKIILPFEQLRSSMPAATKSPFAATPPMPATARMSASPAATAVQGSPVTMGRVQEAAAKLNAALRTSPGGPAALHLSSELTGYAEPAEDLPPLTARTTDKEDEARLAMLTSEADLVQVCQACYTMERDVRWDVPGLPRLTTAVAAAAV